ncbi:MAG: DNA polymerase III subunit alpha [Candidatus Brocadiia bacterium]
MDFVHLHAHSTFSLLQGVMRIEELIQAAARRGSPAVALTDTNGLYGAMFFYGQASAAGLKPIIGAELVRGGEQCICLAADRRGYANLCRIITARKLAGTPHYATFGAGEEEPGPFDPADCIAEDPRGLFVLTATPSLLRRLAGRVPEGRLYAELRADGPRSFETRCPALRGDDPDPVPAENRRPVADLAERLGVPLAATVNANFLHPEPEGERHTHAVASAIRENMMLKDLLRRERMLAGPHSFLQPARQVAARLPAAVRAEAMRNTVRIAERCNLELDTETPHFPRADLPPGETAPGRLRRVAYEGARRRYGRIRPDVRRRLDKELAVIEKLDFCDYFLVVRDIVEFAEREEIPHVGRGSAANSIVSYSLGISAVDPIRFELPFERFLNEFRTDVPDIDIDFCWRRRDDVIDYVYRRHGAARVAMVSTHSTLRARSAFRDVARVMGLPMDEIDSYSKLLPRFAMSFPDGVGAASRRAGSGETPDLPILDHELFPEMEDFPIAKEPWRTVVRTALKLDGCVRHLSIHLGGLVIGDRPLTWYTPLEDSAKGIVVTQYEMDEIETTGLVKMDLLGQRSLSIVSEAARAVRASRGVELDLDRLPDSDPPTADLLAGGHTMGCFQIESPGMRQLLHMLRASSIMDLIQALSLIRPGPSSSGMKHAFIRRRRGEEPVRYSTPLLKEALGATYGVMLYQEDILHVARTVAGFTLAEGDELRKFISKDRSLEKLQKLRDRFVRGAVGRGVERSAAEDIWKRIEDFAAYSYCKAHATTYGHISYQAAYLKAHWPAEFLASVIANKAGFYDPRTYLADARRFGVEVLAPCVNRSDVEYRAEGDAIRPGLEFVRALSRRTVERLLKERLRGEYRSLEDFCARVRPGREELENLILGGTFDSLGLTRPTLLMKMERILSRRERQAPSEKRDLPLLQATGQAPPGAGPAPDEIHVPAQPPYTRAERVLWELRTLGITHSGHPLDAWGNDECRMVNDEFRKARSAARTSDFRLQTSDFKSCAFVGWLVTSRRAVTKNHEYMKFVTLEDREGVVEVILFPDVYREYGARIAGPGVYCAEGKVKQQHGVRTLIADSIEPVPLPAGRAQPTPTS